MGLFVTFTVGVHDPAITVFALHLYIYILTNIFYIHTYVWPFLCYKQLCYLIFVCKFMGAAMFLRFLFDPPLEVRRFEVVASYVFYSFQCVCWRKIWRRWGGTWLCNRWLVKDPEHGAAWGCQDATVYHKHILQASALVLTCIVHFFACKIFNVIK